jgi:hypothetical protein
MIADKITDITEVDRCKITRHWKQCTTKMAKVAKEEEEATPATNSETVHKG